MELILGFVAALTLLGFAALKWGVDSRTANVDPSYPTTISHI